MPAWGRISQGRRSCAAADNQCDIILLIKIIYALVTDVLRMCCGCAADVLKTAPTIHMRISQHITVSMIPMIPRRNVLFWSCEVRTQTYTSVTGEGLAPQKCALILGLASLVHVGAPIQGILTFTLYSTLVT